MGDELSKLDHQNNCRRSWRLSAWKRKNLGGCQKEWFQDLKGFKGEEGISICCPPSEARSRTNEPGIHGLRPKAKRREKINQQPSCRCSVTQTLICPVFESIERTLEPCELSKSGIEA